MITFYPIGRLGNLMFQTAATLGYARKFNYSWGVPRDTREVPRFHQIFPGLPICDDYGRRYKEHPDTICNEHGTHFDVCHYDYHNLENRGDSVCLFGFYQSLKYFENVQDEVKRMFKLDHIPGYEDYVSIHVRRGDYVLHSGSFPPVNEDYLYKAMGFFALKGYRKFIFFSDDIQWCKDFAAKGFMYATDLGPTSPGWLGFRDVVTDFSFEFSEGLDEKGDLSLMASCGHHIIANSSFSWWASYLGHNPDKVIVSPAQSGYNWFGPTAGVREPKTLIPDNWIQISFR